MSEEVLERSVGRDQLAGALVADAGHPFDVVDRVAHQGHHVDDLLRRDAEFLLHAAGVVPGAFVARIEDADAAADELKEVLVHRDDRDVESRRRRLDRQRADDVVGLVALGGEDRNAERFAGGVHHLDLLRELVRHRRPVGLVVRRQVVAKRAAGEIEGGGDVLRLLLVHQLPQHVHEDVDGVGRLALGVVQQAAISRADRRVIRAVHLRAAVDEIDDRSGGHGGQQGTMDSRLQISDWRFEIVDCRLKTATIDQSTPIHNLQSQIFNLKSRTIAAMRRGAALALAMVIVTACGSGGLFRQYQYEEEIYLSLDGSATVYVNSSVPALNALRGASFDTSPNARLDLAQVRAIYETPVTHVTSVKQSRRSNRRFVHVRLDVADVRRLGEAAPFAWSAYGSTATAISTSTARRLRRRRAKRSATSAGRGRRSSRSACICRARSGTTTRRPTIRSGATSWCGNRRSTSGCTANRSTPRREDGSGVDPLLDAAAVRRHVCGGRRDVRRRDLVDPPPRSEVPKTKEAGGQRLGLEAGVSPAPAPPSSQEGRTHDTRRDDFRSRRQAAGSRPPDHSVHRRRRDRPRHLAGERARLRRGRGQGVRRQAHDRLEGGAGRPAFLRCDEKLAARRDGRRVQAVSGRHQRAADDAGGRRDAFAQRRLAATARPVRLPPSGALVQGGAVPGQDARKGRHGHLPREHRRYLCRHRVGGGVGRGQEGPRVSEAGIPQGVREHPLPRDDGDRHQAGLERRAPSGSSGPRSSTRSPTSAEA